MPGSQADRGALVGEEQPLLKSSVCGKHGRRKTYVLGCRCDLCTQAETDYKQRYRAKQRAQGNQHDDAGRFAWMERAACRGTPTDTFYSEDRYLEAHATCAACPVRGACLDWALDHERFGYWGGQSERQRAATRRARRRGEMGVR